MNEAPCSWRVSTYSMDDLDTASVKRMFSSPGMPKTCVTPSFSRHSTISSAVVRVGSPITASLAPTAQHQSSSARQIPLPEIGRQNIVLVHVRAGQADAGIRRGDDDSLIEHGGGFAFAIRPRPGLPRPVVARGGRLPDDPVGDRPSAHPGMAVDAGALDAQYRVDAPKPFDRNVFPGAGVDVFVDAEEDRRRIRSARSG